MTITSTGPSGLHLKPIVTVFAAAVFAIAIVAIVLWTGTDNPPSSPTPTETATEAVTPDVAPSANWDAYADGKLDDAPLRQTSTSAPVTQGVVGDSQSANFDALATGRLDMELAAENPSRYAASGAGHASANWDAYADGKLDDSAVEGDSTTHQPVVSGGHQEY